jgi:hypothetical protein
VALSCHSWQAVRKPQTILFSQGTYSLSVLFRALVPPAYSAGVLANRSLYVVCLLLSVKYGLFGFQKPDGESWATVGAGTGQLEDGLLLALQALGDTGVDEFVKKKDWPPIDTALRFRQNFGFLLK